MKGRPSESPSASPVAARREALIGYLEASLRWAEALVEQRIVEVFGPIDQQDPAEVARSLTRAEQGLLDARGALLATGASDPFDALAGVWDLDPTDLAILRLALAPVLDSSFRRRIARFRDNVLLDYPDVDFLLQMISRSRLERLRLRERFLPGGALLRARLISLVQPRDLSSDSLLVQEVRLPDRIVNFLMAYDHLDRTVAPYARIVHPEARLSAVVADPEALARLVDLALPVLRAPLPRGSGVVLGISGPPGTGKTFLAMALAAEAGRPVVQVDGQRLAALDPLPEDLLDALFQEAAMRRALLLIEGCEALLTQRTNRVPALLDRLDRHPGVSILCATDTRQMDPSVERHVAFQLALEPPDVAGRRRLWETILPDDRRGPDVDLAALAQTFEFTGGQIRNAVMVAERLADPTGGGPVRQQHLLDGAWAQVRADMEEYARRSKVRLTLEDLILPEEEKKSVREVLDAARHRTFILTHWGFGARMPTGRGLVCLFVGEPGTGKTLCAEILAEELGQNLYQISIPRVMSKYIGETEKNIERIFQTARANNSILLFDEADALFTSRVKVETSVDRFSNMEINLLLQEIERFDGIVILTTNLEKNLDKAFERRIQFKIRFPFPDRKHRTLIWRSLIPRECPVAPDIDWDLVGESFELSGGHIKNAILRAAYRAARDGRPISMDHLVDAAEAECRHAGKLFRGLKQDDF